MRRPRKSRHGQPPPPQALAEPPEGPLGSWAHGDVLAMPRFPDRDSFPTAKDLINRFLLQDGLSLRDLRIALFWLGFGLLEAPTPERPTMSLVPLCKDLDLYVDTAVELGYDPSASVHGRPAFQRTDAEQLEAAAGVGPEGTGPSSSSSGSHSSSSSSGPHGTAASSTAGPPPAGGGHMPRAKRMGGKRTFPPGEVSLCLPDMDDIAEEEDDGRGGFYASGPLTGGGASSRACAVQEVSEDGGEEEDLNDEESQLVTYKVKLFHAGGWSSSSGSEGHRTPPTPRPPASSSAAAAAGGEALAGGLDADHVGQFTVSFVSDLELHEELAETSCLCTFCLDDMKIGEELCRLPCMHTFHRRCVYAWLQRDRRCMLCRLDVTRPCG
uniref:RING-type E3 ubiquitin transferase n=1 Tax=Alexandrium catenella TaxID=2925 RepID=A0A7S1QJT0_ALECA